ncbi:MAG: GntR family transcriptional regulator [Betaproteobacteria bacterium]
MEAYTPKTSLSEEAYAEIRRALLRGDLEPGQRLSEPELALKFKTSRSPVREALMRLEHEGFVERLANGRLRVAMLNVSDLEQLYVVRATLEGLAARLATPLLRTVDLESMSATVEEMERCVKKRNSPGAIAAGQQFHDVITRECGNQPLVDVLSGLRSRINRFRAVVASFDDYDPDRVTEHRRILKAFYSRNAEQAEAEMMRHVQRSAAVLVSRLRQNASK